MTDTSKQTIIEEGTEIEGTVRSRSPMKVSGALSGNISAPSLIITQTGSVRGQVKVQELRSEGEISGQIEAESVQLSGRVNDQTAIRATSLEVKLAQPDGKLQVTFGNVELHVGERPAKAAAKGEARSEPEGSEGDKKNAGRSADKR